MFFLPFQAARNSPIGSLQSAKPEIPLRHVRVIFSTRTRRTRKPTLSQLATRDFYAANMASEYVSGPTRSGRPTRRCSRDFDQIITLDSYWLRYSLPWIVGCPTAASELRLYQIQLGIEHQVPVTKRSPVRRRVFSPWLNGRTTGKFEE
ncbi:hypothetical protein PQR66_27090 [Paraburkholderia agricolaris]|uniref:Uncharacterized protein n=1 Tax=Paraburkholderia agricolaris TaxID=2152888 RepID=A0ABW8ZVA3_9BURK